MPRPVLMLVVAAVALRLVLFLGRGDYVAFDEGWYLLLGRNVWSGDGYTLSGLSHVALSPLFPLLAGGVGRVLGDPVWGGRLVAAVCSGLVVWPCWSVFRRLSGARVALLGGAFVAFAPSMAPFVVPYWIGWDLWVGAEPLLHLFLFTGIALFVRAWEEGEWASAAGCGGAFSLAYLARPEAVGLFGLLGLGALALGVYRASRGRGRMPLSVLAGRTAVCGLVFVVLAAPYWLYLHGELGRWTVTGRAVRLVPETVTVRPAASGAAQNRIEAMLWEGDGAYVRRLYALDASGTRLANGYWGVRKDSEAEEPASSRRARGVASPSGSRGESAADDRSERPPAPGHAEVVPGSLGVDAGSADAPAEGSERADPSAGGSAAPPTAPPTGTIATTGGQGLEPWLLRYARAVGVTVPWYLWLFVAPGLFARGKARRPDIEALVGIPLLVTSWLVARMVAIDPRTQLFLAPLAAFYAARGVWVTVRFLEARLEGRMRPGAVRKLLVGGPCLALLATTVGRLVLSLSVGSPHHVVSAENAAVGEAIRSATPASATVVSFHPAVALFADRDWRVLPVEPMDRIIRYARTLPDPYLVLSVFYPPEVRPLEEPHYLIVPVAPDLPEHERWRIHVPEPSTVHAFGTLVPEG